MSMISRRTKTCIILHWILALAAATATVSSPTSTGKHCHNHISFTQTKHERPQQPDNNRRSPPPQPTRTAAPRTMNRKAESPVQEQWMKSNSGYLFFEGTRRRPQEVRGIMKKRKKQGHGLSCLEIVRGGAAGAWRVVDPEGRKERQAVRNVLLYYPNLIGMLFPVTACVFR